MFQGLICFLFFFWSISISGVITTACEMRFWVKCVNVIASYYNGQYTHITVVLVTALSTLRRWGFWCQENWVGIALYTSKRLPRLSLNGLKSDSWKCDEQILVFAVIYVSKRIDIWHSCPADCIKNWKTDIVFYKKKTTLKSPWRILISHLIRNSWSAGNRWNVTPSVFPRLWQSATQQVNLLIS